MRLAHIVSFFSGLFSSSEKKSVSNSIYDFKIKSLGGREVDFSQYRGQKLLLVNTAQSVALLLNMQDWKNCMSNSQPSKGGLVSRQ